MTNEELCWLAGWLEGEGSFASGTSNLTRCQVRGVSTDKDVIEKVAALMGCTSFKQNRRTQDKAHWKDTYRAILCGQKAFDLMARLYPLMCERRQQQIKKAMDNYNPTKYKFNESTVTEIKNLAGKMTQKEIAVKYKTNRTTINKIVNSKY
jgi:CMP-N-acetylneuraminic acid synthetase